MNKQETKKLDTKVQTLLKDHVTKKDTIVVGVSGGPDSVFLLHQLKKFTSKVIVAHVNHKLRKKDSDLDEKFTKLLAKDLDFTYENKASNIAALSKKSKKGLEETGRKVRYDFFKKLAKKHGAKFIATAHHADDNLETIIMNFLRGSSLQGLSGMQITEAFTEKTSLLRPLLDITKNQITSYLKSNRLPFRTDKTNTEIKFTRNYIRHEVIPSLQKLNPNLAKSVAKNAINIRQTNDFLKKSAQKFTTKPLALKQFKSLHPALQKAVLLQLYKQKTGSTKNIESVHLDEVIALINQGVGNKHKKLGKLVVSIKKGIIVLL